MTPNCFHFTYEDYCDKIVGQYRIKEPIGSGAYGCVFKAVHVIYGTWHALKCIPKMKDTNGQVWREVKLHSHLSRHPLVVTLERVIETTTATWLALELAQCDLFSFITEKKSFSSNENTIKTMFLQIIEAVSYCHSQGVAHRDIKPENILLYGNNKTCKLADFGLATSEERTDEFGCGSSFYLSPECQGSMNTKSYATKPNDVWSLGVILINLIVGRNPWKQANHRDQTFLTFLKKPDFLKKILPISDEVNDILMQVFKLDPDNRLTIEELKHKIINCNQFKRKPMEQKQEETCSHVTGDIAGIMPSPSQTSIQSESSWTSCHSNISSNSNLSVSKSFTEVANASLVSPFEAKSSIPNHILEATSKKVPCPSSLRITDSTASTDSDASECCTPETQLKDVLWNQTSIKTSTAEVLPDREHIKQIYSNSPNAYYLP